MTEGGSCSRLQGPEAGEAGRPDGVRGATLYVGARSGAGPRLNEAESRCERAGAGATAIEGEKPTMANKMAHCPSAVTGAKTDVVEDNGKVVITVTAEGEARVVEIQKRAEQLDKVATAPDAEVKHTGMGTGGGKSGRCPVVMTDVTLEIAKLANGVTISLSPHDPGAVGDLARMARERVTAMASGGGGGAERGADEASGDNE